MACHVAIVFLIMIGQDETFRLEYRIAYHVTKPSKLDWQIVKLHLDLLRHTRGILAVVLENLSHLDT